MLLDKVKNMTGWIWPGITTAILIFAIIFTAFGILWQYISDNTYYLLITDRYIWHVVSFTFIQAILSTLCSTLPALALARALYYQTFPGRDLLLRILNVMLAMPALVGIFGIISVFGQQGWLSNLFFMLKLKYHFFPYGLNGILLTHVFLNLPLATVLLLKTLENIPIEQHQLAAQLGMTASSFFFLIEWPYLRRQLPSVIALIFMLCFTSFATVATLGGGPNATTIELAIYQALSYDLDIGRATLLALTQIICCTILIMISQKLNIKLQISHFFNRKCWFYNLITIKRRKLWNIIIIITALLFLLPPLLAVIIDGINRELPVVLQQVVLWKALFTSLSIALCAGTLCIVLTTMLVWSNRELHLRKQKFSAQIINLIAMMIISVPGTILATSFFLLTIKYKWLLISPVLLVIITNTLMSIPYALKVLENPMQDIAERYWQLCLSLNINGFNRLRLIEWRLLRYPIKCALIFACILSLGDFSVIGLFSSENFYTLSSYLYQQISAYRSQDSAVTALILLLLYVILLIFFEKTIKN